MIKLMDSDMLVTKQVGDPKQLPATLISQSASKMGFELSMFERLQRAGYPVTVLNTQVSVS
jgi:superfamily I DNA and/or RNA helicase